MPFRFLVRLDGEAPEARPDDPEDPDDPDLEVAITSSFYDLTAFLLPI
jgi:hypothetical protein